MLLSSLPDHLLTVQYVHEALEPVRDDLWVAAACADRLVDDIDVQRHLLQIGLQRTESALERCQAAAAPLIADVDLDGHDAGADTVLTSDDKHRCKALAAHFHQNPTDAHLCRLRTLLLQRLDRLNTYVEMCTDIPEPVGMDDSDGDVDMSEWDDDPWDDDDAADGSAKPTISSSTRTPPLSLSTFLTGDLFLHSCFMLSNHWFSALPKLFQYHSSSIWPCRFTILAHIPAYALPSQYRDIFPSLDHSTNEELPLPSTPWRSDNDWSERSFVKEALEKTGVVVSVDVPTPTCELNHQLLSSQQLAEWYKRRVHHVVDTTGMVDIGLSIAQHGASQAIPGLDELGEELTLYTRLIYDSPRTLLVTEDDDDTFSRWLSMDPMEIIRAYVAHSTPETIASDIQRLVMPYLFVLEARSERSGSPDPELPNRLLYQYILDAPIDLLVSIFEASKPTLPPAGRLIRDDEDIARLALASLYGSDSLHSWPTMSRIFECLPAWDIPRGQDADEDVADTTMASLGDFVTPTTSKPRCTSSDLLIFFKPLPLTSLSRALDILDVHLESGEILSRWSVPAPLQWFLRSNGNEAEQRAWANRMARRGASPSDRLNTLEDWEWLLEDMLKLCGRSENGIRGAFGLLHRKDIMRIFFAGLLGTGKFDIAKSMIRDRKSRLTLKPNDIEEICITSSYEFYDNAGTANYKIGDMKLAYDCLSVPAQSERVHKEKEFIEATSRLSSFNIMSRGNPISPIEIRLTKNRLSLVSRVLSSTSDAYKHTEVILDLVYKLGFRNEPVAEVKALSMISDTALVSEDFSRAYEIIERMINIVLQLPASGANATQVKEANEVCWVACFQLGRQPEFDDVDKKLTLLGRAIELCPPDQLNDVLNAWRTLDKEDIEDREQRLENRRDRKTASRRRKEQPAIFGDSLYNAHNSLAAKLQDFRMPATPLLNTPDAAALASRTFRSVAANFSTFTRGRTQTSQQDNESHRSGSITRMADSAGDVSAQASRALSKGIGWLIGDE